MKTRTVQQKVFGVMLSVFLFTFPMTTIATAHCDTMNGPVIKDARIALEKNESAIILKWVKKEFEHEVIALFAKTVNVRVKSAEAKELADRLFFETLVRLHRAGEGMPYTGLKETEVDLVVQAADQSIAHGNADVLTRKLANNIEHLIHQKFESVLETKVTMNQNVEAGRNYVEAYVQYVHLVEQINSLGKAHSGTQNIEADSHNH